eukprot:9492046-Pyramimonas_sp.AAC.1
MQRNISDGLHWLGQLRKLSQRCVLPITKGQGVEVLIVLISSPFPPPALVRPTAPSSLSSLLPQPQSPQSSSALP